MSFFRNLFGKEQPVAPASDTALSEAASPVALRIHRVVNEMCAKPGRSFSKQAHAAPLYELLPASQIPRNVADLFVEATTFTAAFTGARTDEVGSRGNFAVTINPMVAGSNAGESDPAVW